MKTEGKKSTFENTLSEVIFNIDGLILPDTFSTR